MPNIAEGEYSSVKLSFKGAETIQENLDRLQTDFDKRKLKALKKTAISVRDRSIYYTPEDTKATKKSTRAEGVVVKKNHSHVDVTVNTPYSFFIHYGYHNWHIPNVQPFKLEKNPNASLWFLHTALLENVGTHVSNIKKAMEKSLKKAGKKAKKK